MAQNLSKEDFSKMQQQAINRVKEMQRQAKAEKGNEPKRIFEPTDEKEIPKPPAIKKVHTKNKRTVSAFLETDSDVALILPLILLLQRDGADEMLILALLYIMA